MDWMMTNFIAAFLLPPLNAFLLAFTGYILLHKGHDQSGKLLISSSFAAIAILSMPIVSDHLMQSLEKFPAIAPHTLIKDVDAIVVLGGGVNAVQPEYGASTLKSASLERVKYAALLHKETGLPILVSGGSPEGNIPEASIMSHELMTTFKVPVRWLENGSNNSAQNAQLSWKLLHEQGITHILLVTHAWHMPRAVAAFQHTGFVVTPAPTVFRPPKPITLLSFTPRALALEDSSIAIHEWIGLLWYKLKGWI